MYTRVSQICIFLSNLKIDVDHNFSPLFRLKALQKTKFWKISCIFWPCPSCPKFYYITHLCEIELLRKFNFFQIFDCKNMYIFQKSHFPSKMFSFEIQYVGVAQKLQEWWGANLAKIDILQWKNWKKLNFPKSSISHRCVM